MANPEHLEILTQGVERWGITGGAKILICGRT